MKTLAQPPVWWLIITACVGRSAEARRQTGFVTLGGPREEDKWQYISKFGMDIGEGTYDMRVRTRQSRMRESDAQIDFLVYLDEDWTEVESMTHCNRASSQRARKTWRPVVKASGEWSRWVRGSLVQRMRPHIWYFALSDCRGALGSTKNSTLEIEYEFHIRQEGGSEFSYEARFMLPVQVSVMLILSVFLAVFARRCWRCWQSNEGVLHPVIWYLTAAVMLQYVAQALHVSELLSFRANGVGVWTVDALSSNLFLASEVLHTTLILIIAQGYTLLPSRQGDSLTFMKLVAAGVLLLHILLVGLGRLQDGASKHHEHDGAVGWAILALRLLLYTWFLRSVQGSQQQGGFRLHPFLRQLQFVGSLYFLAYPLTFLVAQAFAPYLRHPVMQVGLLITRLASSAWLANLFLSRGRYFRLSELGASLLPGTSPTGAHGGLAGTIGWNCGGERKTD